MEVQSLSWEDPLEEGMVSHSSILPGESLLLDGRAWWATVHRIVQGWIRLKRLSMQHTCIM